MLNESLIIDLRALLNKSLLLISEPSLTSHLLSSHLLLIAVFNVYLIIDLWDVLYKSRIIDLMVVLNESLITDLKAVFNESFIIGLRTVKRNSYY